MASHGVSWQAAKKLQQSTDQWQDVRCAGHGVWWPGATKIQSSNRPLAGCAVCWPRRVVAGAKKDKTINRQWWWQDVVLATA